MTKEVFGFSPKKEIWKRYEYYLQEAQSVGSLGIVVAYNRGLTDSGSKSSTLTKSAVLDSSGEERRGVDLFPKIETL